MRILEVKCYFWAFKLDQMSFYYSPPKRISQIENKFVRFMIKPVFKFNVILCFLILINCSGKKDLVNDKTEITFDKITSQSHGGNLEENFIFVKSNDALKKIFAQLNIARKPGIPLPMIDFNKESVIVLFMGQQNSGGYTILLESAKYNNTGILQLFVKETKPSGMSTMAITQPYSIYKIHKPLEKVNFVKID